MIDNIKTAYCFYIVQLLLSCKSDTQVHEILDKIIDEGRFEQFIQGDADIKKVFEYVYRYRQHLRHIINDKPSIDNSTIAKVMVKSIF
jgi:hypothetical protein